MERDTEKLLWRHAKVFLMDANTSQCGHKSKCHKGKETLRLRKHASTLRNKRLQGFDVTV